jgi:histidinol-phosphate aminotransferase
LPENFNRYPDPMQVLVKEKIGKLKNVDPAEIFIGNGSDEAIDILFRSFCAPGKDNAIICPPTYGMYEVSANVNDVAVKKVSLQRKSFQPDVKRILAAVDPYTKLVFICSPNNPTGNIIEKAAIEQLLREFKGIVVLDEAYADFSGQSFLAELREYPNLVILQTFSKAWGMAGLRVGMAFASAEIVAVFNKVKPPYNVNVLSQELVLTALENEKNVKKTIERLVSERERLASALVQFSIVETVYPSDANFILLKVKDASVIYRRLVSEKLIVRDRSNVRLCEDCLRITIGTKAENDRVITLLKRYEYEKSIVY